MQGMTLRQGNCLELMRDIPDDSVDMIFSDPPYGTTACDWDVPIDWAAWWKEARRITKKNAPILLFSQMPFTAELVMTNRKDFRYEWIVEKGMATGFLNASRMPLKCHENVLVFYRALPPYNPIMTKGTRVIRPPRHFVSPIYHKNTYDKPAYDSKGRRYPRDVLRGYFKSFWGKTVHPTQKPVVLAEYFIKTYSNEGALVLDAFMGSGTAGVACRNTGRRFIGMELDERFFAIAKRRTEENQPLKGLYA